MQLKALLNVTIIWGICTGVLIGASKLHTLQVMVKFCYFSLQSDHDIKSTTQVLVQTFSDLQIFVCGFLQFVANDVEDGDHHWHHLTHQSVSSYSELLFKHPLCLYLISNTLPASVWVLIVVTWTEVRIIGSLLQHFPHPSTRKLSYQFLSGL